MKRTFYPVLSIVLIVLFLGGCDGSNSSQTNPQVSDLSIDIPSVSERVFAEKRDFIVFGRFDPPLEHPGDVRVEVYWGSPPVGDPIRVVESHVDPATGITSFDDLYLDYSKGTWWPAGAAPFMTPDLVKEPGGFLNPANKCVVTNDYYAAVVLGGASKDFDTTYTDASGLPLTDLTAGVYTVRVAGISGKLEGASAVVTVTFLLTDTVLGRFWPESHLKKLTDYARSANKRIYCDYFPGYFTFGDQTYEIKDRWQPNNASEVVNNLPGTLIDAPVTAVNDVILYNVSVSSTTHALEIAAITRFDLTDSVRTTWRYYDVGEPSLVYTDMTGQVMIVDGRIVAFANGDKVALTRAEIADQDQNVDDNTYIVGNTRPTEVDLDFSDGVQVESGKEVSVFGVAVQIPSTTRAGGATYEYVIDNRITWVKYTVLDDDSHVVYEEIKDVGLNRYYDPSDLSWPAPSLYEFRHEFISPSESGSYTYVLQALDADLQAVDGGAESFLLQVQ